MKLDSLYYLFQHLESVIIWRINHPNAHFKKAPQLDKNHLLESPLQDFIKEKQLTNKERIVLLVALLPELKPLLLKKIAVKHDNAMDLVALCYYNNNGQVLLPTTKLVYYILGDNNTKARAEVAHYFSKAHLFQQEQIIKLLPKDTDNGFKNDILAVNEDIYNRIIYGVDVLPTLSKEFPAALIKTKREWADLILPQHILAAIQSIQTWYDSSAILMNNWGMKHTLKPGYRVLFYGEPGTGKTLAASLLGKYTGRPVFRVDVSMLVSKYIGETEKHLANLFDKAEHKDWILFFDEADAIFGKRTNVRDAHDKYANQEVSYLLQRIETFSGLVILASNFKNNMDKAFTRRFHLSIKFNNPQYEERLRIWQRNLPKQLNTDEINLEHIAKRYELTGSNIMNIIQDASLRVIASNDKSYTLTQKVLLSCIKREYDKEDKIF